MAFPTILDPGLALQAPHGSFRLALQHPLPACILAQNTSKFKALSNWLKHQPVKLKPGKNIDCFRSLATFLEPLPFGTNFP